MNVGELKAALVGVDDDLVVEVEVDTATMGTHRALDLKVAVWRRHDGVNYLAIDGNTPTARVIKDGPPV